jgi:hypothetical protein
MLNFTNIIANNYQEFYLKLQSLKNVEEIKNNTALQGYIKLLEYFSRNKFNIEFNTNQKFLIFEKFLKYNLQHLQHHI